jgi:hypothetical protein
MTSQPSVEEYLEGIGYSIFRKTETWK